MRLWTRSRNASHGSGWVSSDPASQAMHRGRFDITPAAVGWIVGYPDRVCREKVIDSDQRISKLWSMGKTFRAYDMNQQLLLPPDLRQWLREDHLALYVSDVVESLDLSAITKVYDEGDLRGRPPYHPALMVKLLIYGYCVGKLSSRKLEQATYDDVAFRVLSCNQQPDHDSIAGFRKRHLQELAGLFVQVLQLCERAGLVKLGHVAIDGTKIK